MVEARTVLRSWLVLSVLMTLGNAIQTADLRLLAAKLFDKSMAAEVTPLYGRLFSQWNFLLVIVRFFAVIFPENKPFKRKKLTWFILRIYALTGVSFLMSIMYFLLEALVFRTASISNLAVIANVAISGLSLMLIGFFWPLLWRPPTTNPESTKAVSGSRKTTGMSLRSKTD